MAEKQSSALRDLRQCVLGFVEDRVYPMEAQLEAASRTERQALLAPLCDQARAEGLWALGHPRELGGGGVPFMDYVHINEVIGRSHWAMLALGTASLQDALMLLRHGGPLWRKRYLEPIVAGEFLPSFAMTEPGVASSDPTQITTRARLENGEWILDGRKWFTTGAADARYTTVMCRTEDDDTPRHAAFSLLIVPTDAPGYRIRRIQSVLDQFDAKSTE